MQRFNDIKPTDTKAGNLKNKEIKKTDFEINKNEDHNIKKESLGPNTKR